MVGYSRLIAADEEGTIERLRGLRRDLIRPTLAEHGDRLIKTMGDGVNIAARLETLCEPGGIVISNAIHEQVKGKLDCGFTDLGPQQVKNLPEPVNAFAVGPDGAAPQRQPRHKWPLLPIAAGFVVLALALSGYLIFGRSDDAFAALPEVAAEPSAGALLVLPFQDYSGGRSLDHFADGLTGDRISDLSRWKELRVIARNTSMTYKGKPVDIRDVARETGTRYVLEGSVRRAGEQMRITAQFIDGKTGAHVWAERLEETGSDILALQEAVITRIVQTLTGNMAVIREDEYARTWSKAETDLAEYGY